MNAGNSVLLFEKASRNEDAPETLAYLRGIEPSCVCERFAAFALFYGRAVTLSYGRTAASAVFRTCWGRPASACSWIDRGRLLVQLVKPVVKPLEPAVG